MADLEKVLIDRIENVKEAENTLAKTEQLLMANPDFMQFLEMQKKVNEMANSVWKDVEQVMIQNDIKQLKGDFGTVTIAERQGWVVDEAELPNKFFKKVVDTTRLTATYRLEGKAPRGATPTTTKYITKRLK